VVAGERVDTTSVADCSTEAPDATASVMSARRSRTRPPGCSIRSSSYVRKRVRGRRPFSSVVLRGTSGSQSLRIPSHAMTGLPRDAPHRVAHCRERAGFAADPEILLAWHAPCNWLACFEGFADPH
jgi:hypothetical protein